MRGLMSEIDHTTDPEEKELLFSDNEAVPEAIPPETDPPKKKKNASKRRSSGRRGSSRRPEGKRRTGMRPKESTVHLVLIGVIVLMLLYGLIRLILWNIGQD